MPNFKVTCWTCGGKGRLLQQYQGDPTKKICRSCRGNGCVPGFFVKEKDCWNCGGRGVIDISPRWNRCSTCKGKGYEWRWMKND